MEDLEAIEATLELLADSEAQDRIARARADIARGDYVTGEEMAGIMAERCRREADK